MVPAFPMDGGRVFRAVLTIPFGRVRATTYAGRLGQSIGLFLFGAGVFEMLSGRPVYIGSVQVSDFILTIIGLFIFFAAKREIDAVKLKQSLETATVAEISEIDFPTLPANMFVTEFEGQIAGDSGILLEVDGTIIGILYTELLTQARLDNHIAARLGDYSSDFYQNIDVSMAVAAAVELFSKKGYRVCPVYDNGVLAGVLSRSSLLAFISGKGKPGQRKTGFGTIK